MLHSLLCGSLCGLLVAFSCVDSQAATRTWIGGNNNWDSSTANWNPADEPDSNDVAVFNTGNFVTMTIDQTLEGLTLSGGINLSTLLEFSNVNGTIDLDGANTTLNVFSNAFIIGTPPVTSINADDVIVTGGATFRMANDVTIHDTSTIGGSDADTIGVMTIGSGSKLEGNDRLLFNNSLSSPIVVLQNNGTISALSYGNASFVTAETFTIDAPDPEARVDLDGISDNSVVNVFREQTLEMNIQQNDDFDGTVNVFHNSTLDFEHAWLLNGVMNVETGFVAGTPPFGQDIPAGVAVVRGGTITMSENDARINNVHNDGTLQFDAPLVANDGVIDNNGHLIFNAPATIGASVDFFMEFDADLTVNSTVTVNDSNWNWDDNGGSNNDLTINAGGTLNANITAAGASVFNGDLHIVGGELNVQGDSNNWEQTGGNITFEGTSLGEIDGDQFVMGGGTFRVVPGADGDITAATRFNSGTLDVDGELELIGAVTWAGSTVIGDGVLEQEGNATVVADTTIGIDTFDWDQSTTTVNSGVNFDVTVDNVDRGNDTFNNNTITLNGGTLEVRVADGSWTLGGSGIIQLNDTGNDPRIRAGSTLRVASGGRINASGPTSSIETSLVVESGGVLEIQSAAGFLDINTRLTLAGGAVNQNAGASNTRLDVQELLVTAPSSINVDRFNWDAASLTTVEAAGVLDINVDSIESSGVDEFNSTITLNSGSVDVDLLLPWTMAGTLNMNNTNNDQPVLTGDEVVIAGHVDVNGGQAAIAAPATFSGTPTVDVEAGASLILHGSTVHVNDVTFSGEGAVALDAPLTVFHNDLTINMPNGAFSLHGVVTGLDHRVQIDGGLTLNVASIDKFFGVNEFKLDTLEINSTGQLNIDLPGSTGWIMNGVMELNGATGSDNFPVQLAGEDVELRGTVDVTDQTQIDVNLEITGTVNLTTADTNLRINGQPLGNPFVNSNRILGGVINGPGTLSVSNSRSLVGFGTINADLDFDGPNPGVFADNGELVINGAILDLGAIGTFDDDGILTVTNPWNSSSSGGVELNGGELRGATLTVSPSSLSDVSGHGLITAPIINNGFIRANGALTLKQIAISDYDGISNDGELVALGSGSILSLMRDSEPFIPDDFHGTIRASFGGTFFADRVWLDLESDSTIQLSDGTFELNDRVNADGAVVVDALSTIRSASGFGKWFRFGSSSTTTLNADLVLEGSQEVELGATFSGTGKLINHGFLDLKDGAEVGVLFDNEFFLNLGSNNSIAQATVADFEQDAAGNLVMDLAGTSLNDYDRLQVDNIAQLDGTLFLRLDETYDPQVKDSFTLILASSITGTFASINENLAPLTSGLEWRLVYNPTTVTLEVAPSNGLVADVDFDGDVDGNDYLIIARTDPALLADWQAEFGMTASPLTAELAAVPEPVSAVLLLGGVVGLFCICGRRCNL